MSGARGCSPPSPADGRALPPLPAPGGMGAGMLCHQHTLRFEGHSSSDAQGVYLCVSGKKIKKIIKSYIFLPWGHTQPSRGCSDGVGTCWDVVRQSCGSYCLFPSCLLLCSSHPSLHDTLQPAPLQRRQLEPISTGAVRQHGQQKGCSGKPWFAAVCIFPLREWLSRHLPTLFPLINIQDNYAFVKFFFARHTMSIIALR